ncbi:MAG: hypothetical protein E7283_05665 [Lachnospiraceae bacterium]|nr:hypothetical protein [Lachnospiraceae bacterium]
MGLFDRIKEDKVAMTTSVLLMISLLMKLLQAGMLHLMTDMYPLTSDNIINTGLGLMPTVMLLVYVLVFYKTEKSQLLLCCTFVFQFAVTAMYAWEDYQILGEKVSGGWVFSNLVWLVYYAFLIYVTYKGFEYIIAIKVIMGAMIAYSVISATVTLFVVWRTFPEETVILVSQLIAIVGNLGHYLATFMIVPKAVEEM